MPAPLVFRGQVVFPDRVERGAIVVRDGRVADVLADRDSLPADANVIDAGDGFVSPGFIDLHVHGGAGGDFMDGTAESFRLALRAHARHGTTRMAVTTTVASARAATSMSMFVIVTASALPPAYAPMDGS